MPFSLSFSEDFFCDGEPDTIRASSRPTSAYQAILSLMAAFGSRLVLSLRAKVLTGCDDPWPLIL
jgi:hypothetical protein